ncbi:Uncharacterised protein [Proteus mirabilis]|uniref:Uncharacterized protein n=1 Tax=Proteus mirabilis TaxID=584 RepID=A0A2X2BY56_PROMI|nr:Uncharacterised protein [Proteus mirabilis]
MLNNNNFTIMSVDQFPIITMQVFPETLEHANNWIAEMDLVLAQKQNFVLVYPPINKKNEQEDMEGMKAVRPLAENRENAIKSILCWNDHDRQSTNK